MSVYGIIYIITNKVNGKLYIGQTIQSLNKRWRKHKHDYKRLNYPLYRAMRKYGSENFQIEILTECINQEELDAQERDYTDFYGAWFHQKGYVLKAGNGQGALSEEMKKQIAKTNTGKKASEETKKKMSDARKGEKNHFYGKKHTEEIKQKLSEIQFGKKQSEGTVKKRIEAWAREYDMISPEGIAVHIRNMNSFCRENNLDCSSMFKVLNRKAKQHKGWSII